MPKKPGLFLPLLLAACALPCGALSLQRSAAAALDELARKYLEGETAYSKTPVALLPIEDRSPLARRYKVGASVQALVEKAMGRSLAFRLVDRRALEKSLAEIEAALAEPGGPRSVPEAVVDEVRFFILGSVTEEGELFRVQLRLVETDTTKTLALAVMEVPVSDIAAYGEALFKPFGFVGPYASAEWDMESGKGGTYGAFLGSAGVSALFPLGSVYLRAAADCLYASGPQSGSALGKAYDLPAGASGTNRVAALGGVLGLGVFIPIAYRVYGHADIDIGLGLDARRSLYYDENLSGLVELDEGWGETFIYFGAMAGAVFQLGDFLALDMELGIVGRQFGFMQAIRGIEGHLFVPLRLALVIPF